MGDRAGRARIMLLLDAARMPKVKGGLEAAINVTPLVDVVLVLLIIFMVVTPLLERDVELPRVPDPLPRQAGERDIDLALSRAGTIKVGKDEVSLVELQARLDRELRSDRTRTIYFAADRLLPFREVRPVLVILRDLGARQVELGASPLEITVPKSAPAAPRPGG